MARFGDPAVVGGQKLLTLATMPTRAGNHQPKSAHEGELQNFAKAAILAIAQKNCSIDDAYLSAGSPHAPYTA
jgi:hypothetical protein